MRANELKTCDLGEMTYLFYLGFPHEIDRTDPERVEMIFTGDVPLMMDKLRDWGSCNTKVDGRTILNAFREVKKMRWKNGVYNPNHYGRKPPTAIIGNIDENGNDAKSSSNQGATDK